MFVCESCLKPEDTHSCIPISHGRCEICGKDKDCYEVYLHDKEEVKLKIFTYEAWVHPKNGGDDHEVCLEIQAFSKEKADELMVAWLKKRSIVTNDFKLIKERESNASIQA